MEENWFQREVGVWEVELVCTVLAQPPAQVPEGVGGVGSGVERESSTNCLEHRDTRGLRVGVHSPVGL